MGIHSIHIKSPDFGKEVLLCYRRHLATVGTELRSQTSVYVGGANNRVFLLEAVVVVVAHYVLEIL